MYVRSRIAVLRTDLAVWANCRAMRLIGRLRVGYLRDFGRVANTLRIAKLEWILETPGRADRISL